jgi:serine-threonine kinase receptor-associated protein
LRYNGSHCICRLLRVRPVQAVKAILGPVLIFHSKVWDCQTGECICTLQHAHIVRAVAFPPISKPLLIATGGFEKKLRIYDISQYKRDDGPSSTTRNTTNGIANGSNCSNNTSPTSPNSLDGITKSVTDSGSFEVGEGTHKGTIKSIIWLAKDILVTAADDNKIRWFDIRSRSLLKEYDLVGPIGSCEIDSEGAIISVAAGKTAFFFSGSVPGELVKKVDTPHDLASVALHKEKRQFVVGGTSDTYVRIYNYDSGKELDLQRGHHGPVWTVGITPDGKMYGTGSEDGTIKLWKFTQEPYGLWR